MVLTDSVSSEGLLSGSQMTPCCVFMGLEGQGPLWLVLGGVAFGSCLNQEHKMILLLNLSQLTPLQ